MEKIKMTENIKLTDEEKELALHNKIAAVMKVRQRLSFHDALLAVNLFLENRSMRSTAKGIAASLLKAVDKVLPLDTEEQEKVQKALEETLIDWL